MKPPTLTIKIKKEMTKKKGGREKVFSFLEKEHIAAGSSVLLLTVQIVL